MRKLILASLSVAVVPTAVQAQEPVRFKYAGVEYEYVVAQQADGSRVITGRNITSALPFRLTVRGRKVIGTFGDSSVVFSAPRPSVGAGTQVASN